ncbi:hypothetical protein ACFVWL_10350 [Microbacterium sp. NPDC058269]|uniref:hypothetical protein n=1 Tax=Microbacterium sp. NPDC058269 TaxID=3346414 RepID=UPI0036D8526A
MTEQTGNNKPNEAEGLAFPLSGNEKLIKEAEQRYPDIEANPETFPTGWSREQERNAFIAGVVFEKALTPTDDEQEALSQIIKDVSANTPGDLIPQFRRDLIVSKILAADFRRTELQGEPSDAQVDAASREIDLRGFHIPPMAVRAALRAAGGVR